MENDLRPLRLRRLATLALAGGSLAVCATGTAWASAMPAPGLRVVWERDLSLEVVVPAASGRVGAVMGAEAGLWPRVDRVETRPGPRDRSSEMDVRGRFLPAARRPATVVR